MRTGIQHRCLALYLVYTSHVYPVSGPGSSGGDGPEPGKCRPCGLRLPRGGDDTVDGRNPAPVDMVNIPLFTGLYIHPKWLFGISSINSMKLGLTETYNLEWSKM